MSGSSILGSAMQKNWTPAAQLAMEGVNQAGKLAASMDKQQTVTTTKNGGGNSGLGGILGTGAGFLAAMIPGMQPYAAGLMVGGGAIGGAVDSAINGGDILGGAVGGGVTGGLAAWAGPGLFGKENLGELVTAGQKGLGIGAGEVAWKVAGDAAALTGAGAAGEVASNMIAVGQGTVPQSVAEAWAGQSLVPTAADAIGGAGITQLPGVSPVAGVNQFPSLWKMPIAPFLSNRNQ